MIKRIALAVLVAALFCGAVVLIKVVDNAAPVACLALIGWLSWAASGEILEALKDKKGRKPPQVIDNYGGGMVKIAKRPKNDG